MKSKKIVVGMSGGVDSSVVAAILIEQGYDVTGVFIEAYNEPGCRTDEDKRDALRVATKLGIKFEVLDLKSEYKKRVVNYFVEEYREGRTPNPDVICNGEIKFGLFMDWVLEHGYECLATGHYARIRQVSQYPSDPVFQLQRPKDLSKDQTYFLWKVEPARLKHVMFPLGEMTKQQVRAKARALGLPNANKPDSMGICMMGELSLHEFLKDKIGEKEGEVIWNGEVVGTHQGTWFFTIGQRGGWKPLASKQTAAMPPLFVIAKEQKTNMLIVGVREECMSDTIKVVGWDIRDKSDSMMIRIRNLGEHIPVTKINGDTVTLKSLVFAPSPGQSAVLYDKQGVVVGGGVIC